MSILELPRLLILYFFPFFKQLINSQTTNHSVHTWICANICFWVQKRSLWLQTVGLEIVKKWRNEDKWNFRATKKLGNLFAWRCSAGCAICMQICLCEKKNLRCAINMQLWVARLRTKSFYDVTKLHLRWINYCGNGFPCLGFGPLCNFSSTVWGLKNKWDVKGEQNDLFLFPKNCKAHT